MRLFARGQNLRLSSDPRGESAAPRAGDRRARRRARPEAEPLDPRLLMASGNAATVDASASPDVADRVAQVLAPYLAEGQFPGISVAVVTDGQVALAQG
jgi:CubicO group peptidase (beta-lactamase class C family)